jgi:UDP-N-acetylglucosamine--N-acetylmuramyl-(pentapeptide) pyrophosphoryl-undecaprenol N-acetylglucosamine transferase
VYPALAVLQALNDLDPGWQEEGGLLWIGGENGMEREIISRQDIAYQDIPAAGLHGVDLKSLPVNLSWLFRGYLKARTIIREFKPDVLFFTGGYLAVPVAYAGRSVPSQVFIPDIEPGLAIRTITNLVDRIAVSVEETKNFTPTDKLVDISGYPVRKALLDWTREKALNALNLDPLVPAVLVFGGSKGARSINQALIQVLPDLLEEVQVLHITGSLDWEDMKSNRDQLSDNARQRYRVFPFLHEKMGAALRAADLVVSRSGASILGEYPLFELPSILIPYPHAWRYQKTNANYLVERGAAILVKDEDLSRYLRSEILALVRDSEKMKAMRAALRKMAQPNAAKKIASQLFDLAGHDAGGDKR